MYSKLHNTKGKRERGMIRSFNTASCVKLVNYLSKELTGEKDFFSHDKDGISQMEVVKKIDSNVKTLKRKQDKFYMLSYNPSQREAQHLVYTVTGKKVSSLDELSKEERAKVFDAFKKYVRKNMDTYAASFNRGKKLSGDDLVYFAKIEEERKYSHDDKEVQEGTAKPGDKKPGINLHCHVIVSRMDKEQKISLSPFAKARKSTGQLNGEEVKIGFNMKLWQMECAQNFNEMFAYMNTSDEMFWVGDPALFPYCNKKKFRHQRLILPRDKILAQEIKFIRDYQNADAFASFLLMGLIRDNKRNLDHLK